MNLRVGARHAAADPRWPDVAEPFAPAMANYEKNGFILNLSVFRPG